MEFRSFMAEALIEARAAAARGEVPVGAVLVGPSGEVVARAKQSHTGTQRPHCPCRGSGDPRGVCGIGK